jgi:hypothetical protein
MPYKNITDSELTVVREKFQTLVDDLVRAGLRGSPGIHAKKKVLVYALKRIGVDDVNITSNAQWEKFFRKTDDLRFDFPGLARYIGSIPVSPSPQASPSFSAADLEMLRDGGISAEEDSRTPSKYWKAR